MTIDLGMRVYAIYFFDEADSSNLVERLVSQPQD